MTCYIENINEYLRIVGGFCSYLISAKDFDKMYSKQWETDRDKIYAREENWPRRYDIELQENLNAGKISMEEFIRQWRTLWGTTENEVPIRYILDRIYTTCNCFWPDIDDSEIDPPLVLNEKLFRQEIEGLFEELKIAVQKMNDDIIHNS